MLDTLYCVDLKPGAGLANLLAELSLSFISHDNLGGIVTSEYLININILDISIYKYSYTDNNNYKL